MSFGQTLFGGSRFIFRALALPLLAFAVAMPLLIETWTMKKAAIVIPLAITPVLLLMALASPTRFAWAGRLVAAIVFVAYVVYAVDTWFLSSEPFRFVEPSSNASPRNALLGLLLIGFPALLYAVTGRFTLRPEAQEDGDEENQE